MTPQDDEARRAAATAYSFEYGSLMEPQVDIAAAFEAGCAWQAKLDAEEIKADLLKLGWLASPENQDYFAKETLKDLKEAGEEIARLQACIAELTGGAPAGETVVAASVVTRLEAQLEAADRLLTEVSFGIPRKELREAIDHYRRVRGQEAREPAVSGR